MQRNKSLVLKTVVVVCLVVMLLIWRISSQLVRVDEYSLDFMGTQSHIMVVAEDETTARRCVDAAMLEFEHIEKLASFYDANSELNMVNRSAFEEEIKIESELFDIIEVAMLYSRVSGGAFDITVGPLVDLWKTAKTKPTAQQLEQAQAKVGYHRLILNPEKRTVQFELEGMKIDLGGVAKGYAIDKAIFAIKQNGAVGGLVDVGGDIRCFGKTKTGEEFFKIGLQNPDNVGDSEKEQLLAVFKVKDRAVATSGDYQRFIEVDGERISHIINPATKTGAKKFRSVTIIAPKAIDADALATAVSVMDEKTGMEIIENLDNIEAVLVKRDGQVIKSSGADEYISK